MLANPLKGEVKVEALGRTFTFVLTFGAQKAITAHCGYKRFRDVLADMDELDDAQLAFMFGAGFQRYHPELTDADVEVIIDQLGVNRMVEIIAEGVRLAYDAPPLDAPQPGPQRARRSASTKTTSTPASSSGSASGT